MAQLTGSPQLAPCNSLDRSTTAKANVGARAYSETAEYVYIKAAGAITTSGDPVSAGAGLDACVRGDSDVGGFVGVAEAPFASGEYGYVAAKGLVDAVLASGVAAGNPLALSATVGQLKAAGASDIGVVGVALAAGDNAGNVKKAVLLY